MKGALYQYLIPVIAPIVVGLISGFYGVQIAVADAQAQIKANNSLIVLAGENIRDLNKEIHESYLRVHDEVLRHQTVENPHPVIRVQIASTQREVETLRRSLEKAVD